MVEVYLQHKNPNFEVWFTMYCYCLHVFGFCRERGDALASKLGDNFQFVGVDIDNVKALEAAMEGEKIFTRKP